MKLMEKTPSNILTELGIRAYTGSKDVPKDEKKGLGLLDKSLEKAAQSENEYDRDMAEYYKLLIERDMTLKGYKKRE